MRYATGTSDTGAGHPVRVRLLIAALFAFLLVVLACVPAAWAGTGHTFAFSFGSPGTGAGQFNLASDSGVAVDQSNGDVYVADTGNHRVDEFTASGQFIRTFGWGVTNGAAEAQTCTTGCQAGLAGPNASQFEEPTFLAVDNAPGGNGDVYVADNGSQANEVQTVTLSGATSGSFTLEYKALFHATTTAGSNVLTHVYGPSPEFGAAVSGPGIPAGATIGNYNNEEERLEISAPASVSASNVVLGMTRPTTVPYNATAAELQTLLENRQALEGHVQVSGNPGGPYTIEFVEGLSSTNVPQMSCDASGLGSGTCTVQTLVEGKNTARIEKFDSGGHLITNWGGTPYAGALDDTICLTARQCGRRFHHFQGVVVKPDGTLLVLHVGVGDGSAYTEWSQSSGAPLGRPGSYGDEGPIGLVIDSADHLYVGETVGNGVVARTSPCWLPNMNPNVQCEEEPVESRSPEAYRRDFYLDFGPPTGIAFEPATQGVYVADYVAHENRTHVTAYDSQGKALETFGTNGEVSRPGEMGAFGQTSTVYLADPGAGRVDVFGPGIRDVVTIIRAGSGLGSVSSSPAGIGCPLVCGASFPEGESVTLTAVAPPHSAFVGWSGGGCAGTGTCELSPTADTQVTATFAYDPPVVSSGAPTGITADSAVLNGVVGRKAGTYPDYSYSDANKNSGITWDEATLKEYLKNPRAKVPGTKMIFPGLTKDDDITNVIAYLKQFGADGKKS